MTILTDIAPRRERVRSDHDDGVDIWEIREADPHPKLGGWIENYAGYHERTGSFAARQQLAATTGVMIYVFDEPLEIVDARGQAITLRADEAFIGGAADATSIARNLGRQRGIHVHAPLETYARVTGTPAAVMANQCFKLSDMIGAAADDLGGRLCDATTSEARYRLLDRFFAGRLAEAQAEDRSPVAWAAAQLKRPDAHRPGEIAREIGWSRKHLTQRFSDRYGFSPDRFRRLARFERFAAAIAAEPGESLAALAAGHGYVDQAHLTRETREFADMTPGALRRHLHPGGAGVLLDER